MSQKSILAFLAGAAAAFAWGLQRQRKIERSAAWEQKSTPRPGTALITGASAGIGAAFARALAREGYRLELLARREDRLRELAAELEQAYGASVEIFPADLTDGAELERAAARVAEIPDLSLLVNNAGFGTGSPFARVPIEPEMKMISLHVTASVRLTHAALQGMVSREHGGIIQVASVAGLLPLPGTVTYGSTKAYLIFFTRALNSELAGSGVRMQALCPGFTRSEFHDVARVSRSIIPSFMWMEAEDVARESLEGLREGREVVIPGRRYRLLAGLMRIPVVVPIAREVQRRRLQMR